MTERSDDVVNLSAALSRITEHWSPRVVGRIDGRAVTARASID